MAALMPAAQALPFLRADERPPDAPWLPERREWRFLAGDHVRYASLCAGMQDLSLLPRARRRGTALELGLRYGPLQLGLQGRVLSEFLSSELGEAQRHLRAAFELPGEWRLHWSLMAGQDLLSGRVRLVSATAIEAGPRRSFRHILAARALRRTLTLHCASLGGDHDQAQSER